MYTWYMTVRGAYIQVSERYVESSRCRWRKGVAAAGREGALEGSLLLSWTLFRWVRPSALRADVAVLASPREGARAFRIKLGAETSGAQFRRTLGVDPPSPTASRLRGAGRAVAGPSGQSAVA